jgi:hypothetical protein
MLAGVEILLERMKTNPEEFVEGGLSKWSRVIDAGWEVLGEQERTALQDAIRSAKREHFNGEVMRVLAGDVEEKPTVEERFYKHKQLMQGDRTTFSSPTKIVSSKNMLAQTTQILSDEFDKAYANSSPYQQRK